MGNIRTLFVAGHNIAAWQPPTLKQHYGEATHWTKPVSAGHGAILIEDPVQSDAASNANAGASSVDG